MEDTAVRAAHELRSVFSRLRRLLRDVASPDGLTPSQTSVIGALAKQDATAATLAAAERVRPQSMAATLAALEQQGLVVRRADPDDGRRQLVSLSDAGQARLAGDRAARQEWLASELAQRYSEEERRTLLTALSLLERLL